MSDEKVTGYIRPIAICIFRSGNWILVGDAYDPTKQELFYRPLGGAIHFGETSEVTLRREIREELGVEIHELHLLGVLENLFTYDEESGHEIAFVYDARLGNPALYNLPRFEARESNGQTFNAIWLELDAIGPDTPPLYPEGLVQFLTEDQSTKERSAMMEFTPKQGQYLAFIHLYTKLNRQPPAEADMQRYFGVTPPTVHQMVVKLDEKGLIERTPGQPRSIKVLVPPEQLPPLE